LHIQKIHRLIHAEVAIQTAAALSMRPASSLAEEFAATADMCHRLLLHANISPMPATPTLTWCCCGKARATKEWQMMAHAKGAGQGSMCSTGQVSVANAIRICMQHSATQDGNVALWCCLLAAKSAHKDQPVLSV
jgi:hypothetical protein